MILIYSIMLEFVSSSPKYTPKLETPFWLLSTPIKT